MKSEDAEQLRLLKEAYHQKYGTTTFNPKQQNHQNFKTQKNPKKMQLKPSNNTIDYNKYFREYYDASSKSKSKTPNKRSLSISHSLSQTSQKNSKLKMTPNNPASVKKTKKPQKLQINFLASQNSVLGNRKSEMSPNLRLNYFSKNTYKIKHLTAQNLKLIRGNS